jgi:uncharacterized protein
MQSVKVVITGPFNAGKTTFIKTVSEITVLSTERQVSDDSGERGGETTVAMDFGRITVADDVVLYLFGTPGQERFSFMWETLSEGMLGFVVLVDAANPASFEDAKGILRFFQSLSDVPYVVAVNRADPKDEEVLSNTKAQLELPEGIRLVPCNAIDRESVKEVLLTLLYAIVELMEKG